MPPYHIIITDNDATVRSVLARIVALTYPSVTISATGSGAEALQLCQQYNVQLLITNQDMPQISGLQLVQSLRSQGSTVPILMVAVDDAVRQAALAAGVNGFVLKPFRVATITAELMRLLPP